MELKKLIKEYLGDVNYLLDLMRGKFGNVDIMREYRAGKIPQSGSLADEYRFTFHGKNIRFQFGPKRIEIEFVNGGRQLGFSAWALAKYAETSPEFLGLTISVIQQHLDELLSLGILIKPDPSGNLYCVPA